MTNPLRNCPVCDGPPSEIFTKRGYDIGTCIPCDHTYIVREPKPDHLESIYGDAYFSGGGDGYPNYSDQADLLIAHGKHYGQLLARYMSPGRVLDIGAAAGFILKGLIDEGWHGDGVEPNASMAHMAKTRFGLNVMVGGLEETKLVGQYDMVTMIQVAAHFFDVRRAFAAAAEATKPGGWWLIETSNKKSFPARVLGKRWHFISPPSIQNWFSPKSLTNLAGQYGFTLVAKGRPRKRIIGAHAKSLLGHKVPGAAGKLIRPVVNFIPDEASLPYPSFDLMWMLLKKCSRST